MTDVTLAPKLNYMNYLNGADREKTFDGRSSYISGLPPTRLRLNRDRTTLTQAKKVSFFREFYIIIHGF